MHYVTAFPSIMNAYLLPISNVAKTPQEMENEKLREKLKKLKLSSPIKEPHQENEIIKYMRETLITTEPS